MLPKRFNWGAKSHPECGCYQEYPWVSHWMRQKKETSNRHPFVSASWLWMHYDVLLPALISLPSCPRLTGLFNCEPKSPSFLGLLMSVILSQLQEELLQWSCYVAIWFQEWLRTDLPYIFCFQELVVVARNAIPVCHVLLPFPQTSPGVQFSPLLTAFLRVICQGKGSRLKMKQPFHWLDKKRPGLPKFPSLSPENRTLGNK